MAGDTCLPFRYKGLCQEFCPRPRYAPPLEGPDFFQVPNMKEDVENMKKYTYRKIPSFLLGSGTWENSQISLFIEALRLQISSYFPHMCTYFSYSHNIFLHIFHLFPTYFFILSIYFFVFPTYSFYIPSFFQIFLHSGISQSMKE